MTQRQSSASLAPLTTLQTRVSSAHLLTLSSLSDLPALLAQATAPVLVLGGGSNVVFAADYPGTIILNRLMGIEILSATDASVHLRVGAGEVWDDLVATAVSNHWWGIENLSAIPGRVGAAPVQNIGAYGVELADVVVGVHVYSPPAQAAHFLSVTDCQFGYRDSIFKGALKGKVIITAIELKLSRQPRRQLGYAGLTTALASAGVDPEQASLAAIRAAVVAVRASKLPDPTVAPNVGSFFKNPVVSGGKLQSLQSVFPDLVYYPQPNGSAKLAAGWMIDQLGWKGRQRGHARVHAEQALVLIADDGDTADLLALADEIRGDVQQRFGVALEIEPEIVAID